MNLSSGYRASNGKTPVRPSHVSLRALHQASSRTIWQKAARSFMRRKVALPAAAKPGPSLWEYIQTTAQQRVSAGSLAIFRILFGMAGVFIVVRFFAYGWIEELYVEPAHHFTYLGFAWVKPWPGLGMHVHFAALGLFSLGIAAGYKYRLCALLFFLGFTYVELLDKTTYLNHYYWAALVSLLMVFLPLNRSLSVDAWRQSRTLWGTAPAGALWLLRGQLAAVYVFAGIAKLNADWLLEAQPLRIWLQDHTALPMVGTLMGEAWIAYAFSWGGAIFDLTIVGWLLWRRSRPVAYLILAAFHLMTYLLFPEIGVFPWLMMGAALLFFPPNWPLEWARLLARPLRGMSGVRLRKWCPVPMTGDEGVRHVPAAVMVLAAVFVVAQILLPLRHYVYPGNVRWNEEGYRFSWRVLLTEKAGMVEYRVYDPATGQRWAVLPEDYLTPLQVERMATQPDMILETAHIIARDFADRGHESVQVFADVFVAMNGRENARLVDKGADLAAASHSLAPKGWLLPMGRSPP